jgi:hypothetical protein
MAKSKWSRSTVGNGWGNIIISITSVYFLWYWGSLREWNLAVFGKENKTLDGELLVGLLHI